MKTDPNARPSQILAALRPKPPQPQPQPAIGLDLEKLDEERKDATADKADLFDFYHQNWGKLLDEIDRLKTCLLKHRLFGEGDG